MAGFRLAPIAARIRRNPWQRKKSLIKSPTYVVYADVGSINASVIISGFGTDTFYIQYNEISALNAISTATSIDQYTASYVEISTLVQNSKIDPGVSGFTQGGLALLNSTLPKVNDTYSTTIDYYEFSTLAYSSIISGVDTANASTESGSLDQITIISGVDIFYSTVSIYTETGFLNNFISISGTDAFLFAITYNEFGSLESTEVIYGIDTFDIIWVESGILSNVSSVLGTDGIKYAEILSANVATGLSIGRYVTKDIDIAVNIRPRLRKNLIALALSTDIHATPKINKIAYRRKPQKTHKTRV